MRKIRQSLALPTALAAALALAACSGSNTPSDAASSAAAIDDGGATATLTPESGTLPEAMDNADGMQTMAEALKQTGIAGVFADRGSYTLLVPDDDAFDALGEKAKAVTEADDHAALAALVKDHLLTGYMTPADISAGIDAAKDGALKLKTLGGGTLTFTKSGDTVNVAAEDGSKASFETGTVAAGSSVAIPLNGVLRKF